MDKYSRLALICLFVFILAEVIYWGSVAFL
jgi:hypothetical protein